MIVADDAGRQIPAERPGLVAHAINEVVDAVRCGGAITLDTERLRTLGGHLDD